VADRPDAADPTAPSLPLRLALALRRRVRDSEVAIVLLAVLIGAAVGAIAWAMGLAAKLLHSLLFGIDLHQPLSLATGLSPWRVLLVLAGGGLLLHGLNRLLRRPRPVDPIEANALHGGRMPPGDSVAVALQTVLSNGVGGSVGLEAGYAQAGGGLASRLGALLALRRADLRVLVGAGAAGAIAAAFNAPITGAFYGFELVIGSYAIPALFPVVACAVTAVTVARQLDGVTYTLAVPAPAAVDPALYPIAMAVGLLAGLLAILLMRGVGGAEAALTRLLPHPGIRLMAGGLGVGGLALVSPVALSSGHGVLDFALVGGAAVDALLVLLLVKALASLLSVGSGFRGGLFFASLLLGALIGRLCAAGLALADPPGPDPTLLAMVGMSAFGAAVIGAPLAMTFLALEMTGSLQVASLVLAAVAVAGLVVRRLFGYNFASWRFHLRGEAIPSAHDIGWIEALAAGRLMRRDLRLMPATTSIGALRAALPLGAAERVALTDAAGAYAGLVHVSEAHAAELDPAAPLAVIARHLEAVLWPETGARDAMALFAATQAEALAVVDPESRHVLGELTESHLLRRFGAEVERRRKEESGLA
jgi:CIC family chloride channel protein